MFQNPAENPSEKTSKGPQLWQAGSLVYTQGALGALFFWLLWGDFGFFLKERAALPTMNVLLKQFQASDFVLALLMVSLPQFLSMVLVPIVGYRSDRFRSKWGRRIPFLAFTVPVALAGMVGLAASPALGLRLHSLLQSHSPGQNECIIVVLGLFWTIFEFSSVICTCLFYGLITDVVPQKVIGRFYALFRMITLCAAMIFTSTLLGKVQTHYVAIFLGISLVYGCSFFVMCFKVKEGDYPPPEERAKSGGLLKSLRNYLQDCFSKSHYLWIYGAVTLGYMCTQPLSLFIYAYAPRIGMSLGELGKYQTLQLLFSLLQSFPLGWLCDRFHPARINFITLMFYCAATIFFFFYIHDSLSLGIAVVVCGTLAGSWATSMLAMVSTLLPRERFATMNSALTVCFALGQMLMGPICGWMLDLMNHEYRYIYYWAALLSLAGVFAAHAVWRRFLKCGGPKAYQAP